MSVGNMRVVSIVYSASLKKGTQDSILNLSKSEKNNHEIVISGW